MLTHQGIQAFAMSQITALQWTNDERVLLLAPFAFTGGVISVFTPAYVVGACVYIEEGLDPARALHLLVSEKISSLTAVPILFDRIAACAGFAQADLSALAPPSPAARRRRKHCSRPTSPKASRFARSMAARKAAGCSRFPPPRWR